MYQNGERTSVPPGKHKANISLQSHYESQTKCCSQVAHHTSAQSLWLAYSSHLKKTMKLNKAPSTSNTVLTAVKNWYIL